MALLRNLQYLQYVYVFYHRFIILPVGRVRRSEENAGKQVEKMKDKEERGKKGERSSSIKKRGEEIIKKSHAENSK